MKHKLILLVLLLFIVILLYSCIQIINIGNNKYIEADDGAISLDEENFRQYGYVPLSGEWKYYDSQFLEPSQIDEHCSEAIPVKFPGVWNDGNGNEGLKGYGTYSLDVHYSGHLTEVSMLFSIAPCEAYDVYINNEQILSVGQIAENNQEGKSQYKSAIVNTTLTQESQIVIHVSNNNYQKGGFVKPIVIGTKESVAGLKKVLLIKDIFVLGSLTIMLVFVIIFMLLYKRNLIILLCFLIADIISIGYVLSTGEFIIQSVVPNISFDVYFVMYYLLSISGGTMLVVIVNNLYKDYTPSIITKITVSKAFLAVFLLLFFNKHFVGVISNIKDIFILLEFSYAIVVLLIGIIKKRENSLLILVGTIVLFGTVLWDMMYAYSVIFTSMELLIPYGLIVFTFCIFIALIKQYQFVHVRSKHVEETEDADNLLVESETESKLFNIKVLGSFEVVRNDGTQVRFRTKKTKELLAFLIHNNKNEVSSDMIVDALWPDKSYDKAKGLLYTSMYYLKQEMNTDDQTPIAKNYLFDIEYYNSDYGTLLKHFEVLRKHKQLNNTSISLFEDALNIYTGGYFEFEAYEWAYDRGADIDREIIHFSHTAQEYYEKHGMVKQEITLCERILKINEYEEKFNNRLLYLYKKVGKMDSYQELKEKIAEIQKEI